MPTATVTNEERVAALEAEMAELKTAVARLKELALEVERRIAARD